MTLMTKECSKHQWPKALATFCLPWAGAVCWILACVPSSRAQDALAEEAVPKFGIFEKVFSQQQSHTNPYLEVTATASFVEPGGHVRAIPLFWTGGNRWKIRFSPGVIGRW